MENLTAFATDSQQAQSGLDDLKRLLLQDPLSSEDVCAEVAGIFGVRDSEVALLCVRDTLLKFVFPEALKQAGSIPISGSAIAARTALTKKPEVFNNFVKVRHIGIFETIKFKQPEETAATESHVIQKLMSVPIINEDGAVWGILQVCRKGFDSKIAGPDFSRDDLQKLVAVARTIGSSTVANSLAQN
jgi:GAF domain